MNLGLADVASLGGHLIDQVKTGQALSNSIDVDGTDYTHDRYLANSLVLTGCDAFYKVQGKFLNWGNLPLVKDKLLNLFFH